MGALKTVFRRIRGRIIPIRVSSKSLVGVQDDYVNIVEVQKARRHAFSGGMDSLGAAFLKYTQRRSKVTGQKIARRISRLRRMK